MSGCHHNRTELILVRSQNFLKNQYKKRKQDEKIFKNHFCIGDLQWFRLCKMAIETVVKLVLSLGSLIWKDKKEVLFGKDKDMEIRYHCFELKSYVFFNI